MSEPITTSDTFPVKDPLNGAPRWRGFNIASRFVVKGDNRNPEMFGHEPGGYPEMHFRWIADWGFNCVRLITSMWNWSDPADPFKIDEENLEYFDDGIEYARANGLHCIFGLWAGPGYDINFDGRPAEERLTLWKNPTLWDAWRFQWEYLAKRYAGIPGDALTFNLLNEPSHCTREEHDAFIVPLVEAVRRVHPERTITLDGMRCANEAIPHLAHLGVVHSFHFYLPTEVTHFRAHWMPDGARSQLPAWPIDVKGWGRVDKQELAHCLDHCGHIPLRRRGARATCTEFGCHHYTPHKIVLDWTRDLLDVFQEHDIGFLMWNFRGSFGVLDSARVDVDYEDWYGHKLDRRLLQLMRHR
jgi:endoglucanase